MDKSRQEDFIGKYYRLVSIRNTCIKDVIAVHEEKIDLPRQVLGGPQTILVMATNLAPRSAIYQ